MERKDDTERERERKGKKKDIASRWTRRLAFTVSGSFAGREWRTRFSTMRGREMGERSGARERESSYRAWSVNLNGKYKK